MMPFDEILTSDCESTTTTTTTTTSTSTSTTPTTSTTTTTSTSTTSTSSTCGIEVFGLVSPTILSNAISYFNAGASFPAGAYQVDYQYGAMKYNGGFGYQLNRVEAYFVLVSDNGATEQTGPANSTAQFSTQPGVEAANFGASVQFAHSGGKIGMYLFDSPYSDNQPGQSSNPTFRLMKICTTTTTTTTTTSTTTTTTTVVTV